MGDRANVRIDNGKDNKVFLYTHWIGSDLPIIVQNALARRTRWDDPQYLARIVFCEMLVGSPEGETTGFGISAVVGDGGDRVIVLGSGCVTLSNKAYTFDEYLSLEDPSW